MAHPGAARPGQEHKMKRGIVIAALAFGVVLALVVGLRLEPAGLGVLLGVGCGVLASVPVSLVLLWALAREREARQRLEERRWEAERPAAPVAPPVFILNSSRQADPVPQLPLLGAATPRNFVIVGEEEHDPGSGRDCTDVARARGDFGF
jgi:hypothetical protein